MHIAAVPGMIFAIAISVLIGMATAGGTISSLVIVTIGGGGGLLLYLLMARLLKISEVSSMTDSLRARLGFR